MLDPTESPNPQLAAALYWQRLAGQGLLHPLSCRARDDHRPLQPQASENGEAILVCADCGYATLVPERVVSIWRAMARAAIRAM